MVYGNVKGNLRARDRIEIKKDGSVVGDLTTARIMIEDGAYFKGSIEIDKAGEARRRRQVLVAHAGHRLGRLIGRFSAASAKRFFRRGRQVATTRLPPGSVSIAQFPPPARSPVLRRQIRFYCLRLMR